MQPIFTDLSHPSSEQLRCFIFNELTFDQAAIIRNHLRICTECQNTIQQLESHANPVSDTHNQQVESTGALTKPLLAMEEGGDATLPLPVCLANHPRYTILNLLGTGGMGTVYRAMNRQTGQFVAIKVLQIFDDQSINRFQREIQLLSQLSHPNLVAIHDASLADDQPYIVMECVEGISLDRLITRKGYLRVADACEIIRQVAEGLSHAHARQVVHRDIKPSNIMVTPQGTAKLLDWGLARVLENSPAYQEIFITIANQAVGTPDYIAPEQLQDSRKVDPRADIYSLGGTLFTLLTGQPPRDSRTGRDVAYSWLQRPDLTITAIRDDTKSGLRKLLVRMLDLNRDRRIASAAEVAEALKPFCDNPSLESLVQDTGQYKPIGKPILQWQKIVVWGTILVVFLVTLLVAWWKMK